MEKFSNFDTRCCLAQSINAFETIFVFVLPNHFHHAFTLRMANFMQIQVPVKTTETSTSQQNCTRQFQENTTSQEKVLQRRYYKEKNLLFSKQRCNHCD